MDILILGIYSFFVWLIFIKSKWLPWTIVSQVIVITIPIIGMAAIILLMNIYAPSSTDVRAISQVVPIVPRVSGQVTEVPIEPNRPIKKGDVLFKIDPVPFQIAVDLAAANLEALKVAVVTAEAAQRGLAFEVKNAQAKMAALTRAASSSARWTRSCGRPPKGKCRSAETCRTPRRTECRKIGSLPAAEQEVVRAFRAAQKRREKGVSDDPWRTDDES